MSDADPKVNLDASVSNVKKIAENFALPGVTVPLAPRAEQWAQSCKPKTAEQIWFVTQSVVESLRIDRARKHERHLIHYFAHRAALCWDVDRESAIETIAEKIAKNPAQVATRLKESRHGCEWLLDRWHALGEILKVNGGWTAAQRSLAFDMMGTPSGLRFAEPWDCAGQDSAQALVAHEIEHLERRKASALDSLDAYERKLAEKGFGLERPRALVASRREEAAGFRRMEWFFRHLADRRAAP
jgi:hypothetical protein